jgi:ubiquinone biosynthesis protein
MRRTRSRSPGRPHLPYLECSKRLDTTADEPQHLVCRSVQRVGDHKQGSNQAAQHRPNGGQARPERHRICGQKGRRKSGPPGKALALRAAQALRLASWAAAGIRYIMRTGSGALRRHVVGQGQDPDPVTAVRRLVVELGPTFIKGSQLLSTRADLLSPQLCQALGVLRDDVDPISPRQIRIALERAYPTEESWPFADFFGRAVASGSIASVYRARLFNGRDVAVKVRRPGIEHRMQADFRLLAAAASGAQRLRCLRNVPVRRMVDQLSAAVLRQLDLAQEAEMLGRLKQNLLGLIRVPEPLPGVSGDGVLVMEYIAGLERFRPTDFTLERRRAMVRCVLQGVFRMLFVHGVVHCDMHPGNLYLTASGEAVLVDAGFVVQLEPVVQRLFAEFFLNMATGRGYACADVVLRSAEHVRPESNLAAFRRNVSDLVAANHRSTAGQFRLAPFASRLFDLQRCFGVAAAPSFVFPLLSLLVIEGMINDFDVEVDFQGEALPVLLDALARSGQ